MDNQSATLLPSDSDSRRRSLPYRSGEEQVLFHVSNPKPQTPASFWDPGLACLSPKRCFCTGSMNIRYRGLIEDM